MNPEPACDKNWCSLKSALPWYFATAILAGIFGWLDSRAKHGWWFIGLETVLFIALATIAVLSLTAKRRRTIVNTQKILVFALCSLMLQLPANAAPPSEAQLQVIQFNRTPSPSATLAFSLQPSTLAQSAFQTNLQHLQHSSNSATAQDLHATLNTDSTNMTACEFVVGLVIVGTVAYVGTVAR